MPKTDYLKDVLLNHALRGVIWTPPAVVYNILFTVAPTDAGGGTEVVGGGYVRQPVTFGPSVNGRMANSVEVVFPTATAAYGDVVAYGIIDALSGGDLMYWAKLNVAYPIHLDHQWKWPVDTLVVLED